MKQFNSIIHRVITIGAMVFIAGAVQAALIEENFNGYTNGDVGGQGGWSTGGTQPLVRDGVGVNTSKVISNSTDPALSGSATKSVTLDLSSHTTAELSIDFYRDGNSGLASWAGIQDATYARGYGVRVESTQLSFRAGGSGGTEVPLTDVAGDEFSITNEKWYRITYTFSPGDNEIAKAMLYNLTDGGSAQLYFGASTPGYAVEANANPLNWDQMRVVTGDSAAATIMFDNITVIPEPATLGLVAFSGLAILLIRRIQHA